MYKQGFTIKQIVAVTDRKTEERESFLRLMDGKVLLFLLGNR